MRYVTHLAPCNQSFIKETIPKPGSSPLLVGHGQTKKHSPAWIARLRVLCLALTVVVMLGLLAACSSAPTPSAGQETPSAGQEAGTITVSLTISCIEAVKVGNKTAESISDKGIVYEGVLELTQGSTVYDALVASEVPLASQTSSMGIYLTALGGLAGGEVGEMSGWVFSVNDVGGETSSDNHLLNDGDNIVWNYVLEPVF
ncbi:MAG: DUF4430 domain-containing protein [Coriobacteriia bacterium]|nr:DUF4430 domain-containing protein [Coriobacteriia bacterium]